MEYSAYPGHFILDSANGSRPSVDSYMRSSSPGPSGENRLQHGWIFDSGFSDCDLSTSSPTLSCPPSWLQSEPEDTAEDEIYESHIEAVPLSSSPPDFTSSSPQSTGSRELDGSSSSSLTSASDGSLLDSAALSRHNSSLIRLPTCENIDDFGQRLHQLLLIALKERERERLLNRALTRTECTSASYDKLTPALSESPSSQFVGTLEETPLRLLNHPTPPILSGGNSEEADHGLHSIVYSVSTSSISSQARSHDEISPIQFDLVQDDGHLAVKKTNVTTGYRVVKRAQSYLVSRKQDEPVPKRQKTCNDSSAHAKQRIYARRTASLRRADSLKQLGQGNKPISGESIAEYPPTVPATPVSSSSHRTQPITESQHVLRSPVPIIAPPSNHTPKLPASTERLAKGRLAYLLAREADGRDVDGLSPGICNRPPSAMLDTMSGKHTEEHDVSIPEDDFKYEWETVMGIGSTVREAVITWLLHVLPTSPPALPTTTRKSPSPTSSVTSSRYSTSTLSSESDSDVADGELGHNLLDQLQNSPETRFHAAWMFLRFFYLAMPVGFDPQLNSVVQVKSLANQKFSQSVWNIALACLAISVKFHRDFLNPLIPVFAQEYIWMAPHSLSYEKLETAHRDILAAFDYRLGVTPQPFMDELWFALSSLRSLLHFDQGWQNAIRRAWSCLYECLTEPDVQMFPISTLTVAALMKGIVQSLIQEYLREEFIDHCNYPEEPNPPAEETNLTNNQAIWTAFEDRAIEDSEGVFCDIQALIGVTDAELLKCRTWMTCVKPRLPQT